MHCFDVCYYKKFRHVQGAIITLGKNSGITQDYLALMVNIARAQITIIINMFIENFNNRALKATFNLYTGIDIYRQ